MSFYAVPFGIYTHNSYSLPQRKHLSAVNVLSAQVYGILVATLIYNGNRTESAWSAKKAEIIRVMSK